MTKSFLLQGVTQDHHLPGVIHLLRIPHPERVIISVGFMNEGGLAALEAALLPIAEQTTVLTGIRNGITSAQGLRKSLEIGCTTYVVDTGSRYVLFHPKVYVSRSASEARLIVGSANLTVGGLNSNIEASLCMQLGLAKTGNASFVADIEAKIDGMIAEYPQHIFQVVNNEMIESLLVSGRVVDESRRPPPTTSGSSRRRELDTIPRMNLKTRPKTRHRSEPFPITLEGGTAAPPQTSDSVTIPSHGRLTLVWQSNPLSRRHLTIPTGATTNQTGSMGFGRGAWADINHRHYFRDEVFVNLNWRFDSATRTRHLERAETRFQLVIRDVNYGVYTLQLSHNTRTNTKAYLQSNSMTQLRWGAVRQLVACEDLLGRILYLYRDDADNGLFVLEID